MAKVTNISDGPRGAYNKGVLVMANPGETIEADDHNEEWFKVSRTKAEASSEEPKPLAKMNKAELLEAAKAANVAAAADDEGKEVALDDATNKQLVAAIEKAQAKA